MGLFPHEKTTIQWNPQNKFDNLAQTEILFFCLGKIGFKPHMSCELISVTKVHSVCGLKQWSRPQISTRHLISVIWSQFISRPNIRLQVLLLTNDNGLSKLQKPPRFSYRWPNNAIVILAIVILTMPQGWLLIWVQCLTIECWRLGHRGWPIRSFLSL